MSSTRRERQLAEIETEVERGDVGRALDLACEHLAEFPEDSDVLALVANGNR